MCIFLLFCNLSTSNLNASFQILNLSSDYDVITLSAKVVRVNRQAGGGGVTTGWSSVFNYTRAALVLT